VPWRQRHGRTRRRADESGNTDEIQGTIDMLILKALSLEPMHGFGIARRIEQTCRGVFKVNPGSLLTAFERLERGGFVQAEWRQTDNRHLTRGLRVLTRRAARLDLQGSVTGVRDQVRSSRSASFLPARRAAAADPLEALRSE